MHLVDQDVVVIYTLVKFCFDIFESFEGCWEFCEDFEGI